ncbi:VQ motif-containing protein [Melia azedarach]|uniref:VQ motif-containing protein n=1 Tax=Melia azedarach TaxID=155640 RepID=A0ACC1X2V4_MELAZ|nr:VQ motif-containing protein [Melia azedarach]
MSTPTDWSKFYQQNLTGGLSPDTAGATSAGGITSGPSGSNLSPEGRVSKPARRRSRASRRTPTTLLNTDTTNFRAMVQQFTGGPTAPFPSAPPQHPPTAGTTFSFGRQVHPPHITPPGYRLQYQQAPQQQGQNNPGYMISLSNMNPGGGIGEGFFQRLGGSLRPPNTEVSEGFLMEMNGVIPRPPGGSGSNENRGNGFMF